MLGLVIMSYKSIDTVQEELATEFFARTLDAKKASGRALGTFVEIITYYLIKQWGLLSGVSIETKLPEYGNSTLTHNVEFTLHKVLSQKDKIPLLISEDLSNTKIAKDMGFLNDCSFNRSSTKKLLSSKDGFAVIKNGLVVGEKTSSIIVANVNTLDNTYSVSELSKDAYAMFECKRVGKEGNAKGPQTIEKAKQGAYVALMVSSLQKVIAPNGEVMGIYFDENNRPTLGKYEDIVDSVISGSNLSLTKFVLTVGIVSNHGNWFTANNKNKELEVLSHSYDWLLFLSDDGLTKFITDIFKIKECKEAFRHSYSLNPTTNKKNSNCFTKVSMSYEADKKLTEYFETHISEIESWFNVLNHKGKSINDLVKQLKTLGNKV